MKILILEDIADANCGGAEKSMYELIECLSASEHEIFLACSVFKYPKNDFLSDVIILNTTALEIKSFGLFVSNLKRIIYFVKHHNIDLVISHTIHNFPLLRILKAVAKIKIITIFKWIYNQDDIGMKAKWGIKCVDKAVVLNQFVLKYWGKFLDFNRTEYELIPDGIKISIREKSDTQNFCNLLFVGRITEGKGILVLLCALAKLPKEYKLTIIGDFNPSLNEFHSFIQHYVSKHNLSERVVFHGIIKNSEIFNYYDVADLVIVPSIQPEAQPLVIVESIMRGTPVIYSNLGGLEFMIEQCDFWYFEPNDSNAISKKIIEINSIDNAQIKYHFDQIREEVLAKYDVDLTHNKFLDLLRSL
jgi:glycosyltransferase involved in cell wall biosynthesis